MNWTIPNTDAYIVYGVNFLLYVLQEISRWSVDNIRTITVVCLILSWLKIQALKTTTVIDDKIITYLIQFFHFKWIDKVMDWIRNLWAKKKDEYD